MAIASVARQATIRRDNTLLQTAQIVNRQKAVAKDLELKQQKLVDDRLEAKTKQNQKNLEMALKTGDIKGTKFAKDFQVGFKEFTAMNNDPAVSQADKSSKIGDLEGETTVANAAFQATKVINKAMEDDPHRNGAVALKISSNYIDGVTAAEFKESDLIDALDSDLSAYLMPKVTEDWLKQQQDIVASATSTNSLAGGVGTQVNMKTSSANFLVLKEDGSGYKVDPANGKPIVVISGENLESFEKFSNGNVLAIDAFIEENEKEDGSEITRLEAMEEVLRAQGAFNIDEATTTRVVAAKAQSAADTNADKLRQNISNRLDFLTSDPSNNLAVLKSGRGVVDSAIVTLVDGATKIKKETGTTILRDKDNKEIGTRYTIVVDPNKLQTSVVLGSPIEGGGEFQLLTSRDAKIQVYQVDVLDKDPKRGLIQLNSLYNATVRVTDRIQPSAIAEEFDRRERENAFKGKKGNPFGVDLK